MLLRRVIEHVKAQNWTAVALDFLIVVVGLFVGLQVDNWWEAQRNAAQERAYLSELREDFRTNLAEINRMETRAINIIEAMQLLLKESALENPSRPVSELNQLFRELTRMTGFHPVLRTYENLIGSGDLKLIENRDLQSAIADFNRQYGITALVLNTHELELVDTFDPYIIANLDYQAVAIDRLEGAFPLPPPNEPDRILEVVGTREFRNVVTLKWVITTDLLEQFRALEEDVETILAILDSELGDSAEQSQ